MSRQTVTCIVQARTGSTRLPGKVLLDAGGRPMLRLMLDRLSGVAVDSLVVATSTLERDDPIERLARDAGVDVVRGCEADVLARFVTALDAHPAGTVVRLTADCPLADPRVVESVIARHREARAAYTSNVLPRTFPRGLDVEVVDADALRCAADAASDPVEREHVTPHLYRRPEQFNLANLEWSEPLGRERWTVDTAADLEFVRDALTRTGDPLAPWTSILAAIGRHALPGRGELVLRPANEDDAERLLAWRNDDDAVRWSITGRAVDRCEHATWLPRVLRDPARRTWIGEVDGIPLGMVRVDVRSGTGTVSVAVDPERRGHGAGTALLRALDDELSLDCQVVVRRALVHPANTASLRIFERAGYRESGLDTASSFVVMTAAAGGRS
jgi:spore coat polysaccharide biosynthesis protein SpsF